VPRLTSYAQFGCESCDGPALFTSVQALAITPDRRIVVADKTAPHIRFFDPTGRVQQSFGRTGQGPGELQTPMAVAVAPDGTVEVVDMSRRRLMRFGPAGEDRGAVALGGFASAGSFAPQGGDVLAAVSTPSSPAVRLVRVTGQRFTDVRKMTDADFPLRPPGDAETLSIAVAPDGSFVVGDGVGAYRILRYQADGTPAGEFGRTIPKARRTPEEIRLETERRLKRMSAMPGSQAAGGPPPRIPEERNYFEAYALRFDEKGRLWVRVERGKPEETRFDVFDATGGYVGEVVVPAVLREFALGAGLLAGAVHDSEGVPRIHVWSIDGAGPSKQR
jgi:hypothetical protein